MDTNSVTTDPNSADSGVLGPLDLDRAAHGSVHVDPTTRLAEVENAGGEPDNSIAPPAPADEPEAAPAKPVKRAAKRENAKAAPDTEKAVD